MNQESRIKKRNSAVLRLIHNSLFMIRKSVGFTQHHLSGFKEFKKSICFFASGAGFTLIELMVVISITAVLGTLGIAGYVNFNRTQVLQAASNEVVTILNLAKSRAQSQIKPPALCSSSQTLDGYEVKITQPKDYALYLRCSGSSKQVDEWVRELPNDISFDASQTFFFPIQTGGVQASGSGPWRIIISGYGRSKTITINPLGGVRIQ